MAYATWTVIFGEQPSAAKWKILGANDASFNDGTGIANLATSTTAISNPYKFSVYKSANQTGIVDGIQTKITFNTETFDTNNNFDTSLSRYTAPVAGFYQFNWFTYLNSNSNYGVSGNSSLYKNGSEILNRGGLYPNAGFGNMMSYGVNGSELVQCSAGDYFEVFAVMDVISGTVTVFGGTKATSFNGFLVSNT